MKKYLLFNGYNTKIIQKFMIFKLRLASPSSPSAQYSLSRQSVPNLRFEDPRKSCCFFGTVDSRYLKGIRSR